LQLRVPSLVSRFFIGWSIRFPFFVACRVHPSGGSELPTSPFCHLPSPGHFTFTHPLPDTR
jgi:hypothetical protein